jgi:hypothetical protein
VEKIKDVAVGAAVVIPFIGVCWYLDAETLSWLLIVAVVIVVCGVIGSVIRGMKEKDNG